MRFDLPIRRALLLGCAVGVLGCDVFEFGTNPMPRFEQTWSIPVDSGSISVAELLPADNSVQILPDSSAFRLTLGGASIAERLGNDCAQCETMNGTNAVKPQFVLTAFNSTALPATVASAAILDGTINVVLTNNLTFDPLFVRTAPGPQTQGFMRIVISSAGGVVLGRDSVNGATTRFAPGSQLTRTIDLTTGTAATSLRIDVTMDSPAGDHNEFISANGTLNAAATVPSLIVAAVGLNVTNNQLTSAAETIDLSELDDAITSKIVRGTLEMTIDNPFPISGAVAVRFAYGPGPSQAITKTVPLPTGIGQVRAVTLDSAEMALLFDGPVTLTVGGAVSSTSPIIVTPRQAIRISNRFVLTILTGGGRFF